MPMTPKPFNRWCRNCDYSVMHAISASERLHRQNDCDECRRETVRKQSPLVTIPHHFASGVVMG